MCSERRSNSGWGCGHFLGPFTNQWPLPMAIGKAVPERILRVHHNRELSLDDLGRQPGGEMKGRYFYIRLRLITKHLPFIWVTDDIQQLRNVHIIGQTIYQCPEYGSIPKWVSLTWGVLQTGVFWLMKCTKFPTFSFKKPYKSLQIPSFWPSDGCFPGIYSPRCFIVGIKTGYFL